MQLKVLGSSSQGNAYILDNNKEALLIECGVHFTAIQKAVNFDITRIKGTLLTHEHKDHAKEIKKALAAQIPCYTSKGTAKALNIEGHRLVKTFLKQETIQIGNFLVRSFAVQHDAAQPLGFLIHHPETGWILFATDTCYLKYKFAGLSNLLIECNYSLETLEKNLEKGIISKAQRDRTIRSHMELNTCIELLRATDLTNVCNVVLIHLSPSNSNSDFFQQEIQKRVKISPTIATKGLIMEFNKTPF